MIYIVWSAAFIPQYAKKPASMRNKFRALQTVFFTYTKTQYSKNVQTIDFK